MSTPGTLGHPLAPLGTLEHPNAMAVITYLEAIRQALYDEMARDERVFVMGEDVGPYGGAFKVTDGLIDKFGDQRVIDTPISEVAIVGSAIGASYMGLRPVCEIQFIDFIAVAFDMLTNFAATSRYRNGAGVPLVVRGPCGGGVGGGPFHSLNPEAFFLNTPGLKMVEPSTAYDAKGLLKAAIRDDDPVLYFEHKFLYRRVKDEVPEEDYIVPIGKAAIRREGSDLSIITFGAMVYTALDAATELAAAGVEAEVLDLRSLAPLDRDAILATRGQDQPGAAAARGDADRRDRRRAGRDHRQRGVRVSRRPNRARGLAGLAGALLAAARGSLPPERGEGSRRGKETRGILARCPFLAVRSPRAGEPAAGARRSHLNGGQRRADSGERRAESDMATNVVMPQMGESIAEGTIVRWIKKVGDRSTATSRCSRSRPTRWTPRSPRRRPASSPRSR